MLGKVWRPIVLCFVLGGIFHPTHAQVYSRRYDCYGQLRDQSTYAIELDPLGRPLVFTNSQLVVGDTLLYTSVLTSLKLDDQGLPVAQDSVFIPLGATYTDANGSQSLNDGTVIVGGSTRDQYDTARAALFRFNSDGSFISMWEYLPSGFEWIGRQAKQTSDRGFVICGDESATGVVDAFLIKTDSTGSLQWSHNYGASNLYDFFLSVDIAAAHRYYAGGYRLNTSNISDFYAMRMDSSGAVVWQKVWGSTFDDAGAEIASLADGNVVMAAGWATNNNFYYKPYMSKLSASDGSIIWDRTYGASRYSSTFRSVKEIHPGGDLIAAGQIYPVNNFNDTDGYVHGMLLRTNNAGDSLWMRYYKYSDSLYTQGEGELWDVLPTPDGGFIAAGTAFGTHNTNDPPAYSQDVWVIKTDSMGCIVPGCDLITGITSQITNMGYALTLYPNPVHDQLHISIKLPQNFKTEGPLTLSVISAEGKIMRQQVVPTSAPEDITIDVSGFPVGEYALHLSDAHTWIAGKKFVVE